MERETEGLLFDCRLSSFQRVEKCLIERDNELIVRRSLEREQSQSHHKFVESITP
jgi:hypothetical protein